MTFDFGRIARKYDKYYATPVGRMVDRIEKSAVGKLLPSVEKGSRLIEIGSGTGHWSVWFASRGYQVTGVEISDEMITVAETKIASAGPGSIEFRHGDSHALESSDNSFDVGVAITVIEFLADPSRAISELARVVKDNGALIFGVLHENSFLGRKRQEQDDPIFTPAQFYTVEGLTALLEAYGEVRIEQCLFADPVVENVESADEIERRAVSEGWTNGNFLVAEVRL